MAAKTGAVKAERAMRIRECNVIPDAEQKQPRCEKSPKRHRKHSCHNTEYKKKTCPSRYQYMNKIHATWDSQTYQVLLDLSRPS